MWSKSFYVIIACCAFVTGVLAVGLLRQSGTVSTTRGDRWVEASAFKTDSSLMIDPPASGGTDRAPV